VGYDRFADGVGLSLPFKAAGNLIGGPLAGIYNKPFFLCVRVAIYRVYGYKQHEYMDKAMVLLVIIQMRHKIVSLNI
jgi:hypothetical protein